MKKIALVTGATSGIGEATAHILAANGFNLIISGRREDRLTDLSEALLQEHGTQCYRLNLDVRDREAVKTAIDKLPEQWRAIDVLVNNAGLASGLSPIESGDIDDWDRMIDTNIKGLLYVTRNVTPLMIERGKGHIINIGSIAGKEIYPNGNVYCATKHAVDALNKSMRLDLAHYPIKVSAVNPGAVETEFSLVRFHGDEAKAKMVYEGFENLVAADIADAIWYILSRPQHVNINDLTIMPTAQPMAKVIHRKSN